jgi:hypothetical protein
MDLSLLPINLPSWSLTDQKAFIQHIWDHFRLMVEKHGEHLAHPDLEAKPKDPNSLWDQFNAVVDALDHLGDHLEAMVTPLVKKLPLFLKGSICPNDQNGECLEHNENLCNLTDSKNDSAVCRFKADYFEGDPIFRKGDRCIHYNTHSMYCQHSYLCKLVDKECFFKTDIPWEGEFIFPGPKGIVKKINDILHQDTPPVKKEDTILKPPPLFRKGEYCPFRRGEGCSNIVYRYCTHTDEKCRFIDDYTEATP